MFFSSRLPLAALVSLCQAFRVGLSAGLSLVDVFRQQERKGPVAARPVIGRMAERLQSGDSLEDVLRDEGRHFPPMFVGMAVVGEQAGGLAEVFRELERYFTEQLTLRRQFISQMIWPVLQLVAAVGIISFMLLVIGMLSSDPDKAFDPLGFGVGPPGVLRFLIAVVLFFGGLAAVYFFVTRVLRQGAAMQRRLLRVPVLGPTLQALALTRFCLALNLTMESSLSTPKALRRSLQATGNDAYAACGDTAANAIKGGSEIATALKECEIFPEEFIQIVETAEEGGQVPEVMHRQSEHYREVTSVRMAVLARVASGVIWAMVGMLLLVVIVRMLMKIAGVYQDAMQGL